MKKYPLAVVILLGAASSAFAAENWPKGTDQSVLLKQGAVRLPASQVRGLITGKTEMAKYDKANWPVCYYSPDGKLYCVSTAGKKTVENWVVRSDGSVCYSKCHYYLRLKGELVAVRSGRVLGVARLVPGNHL